MIVAFDTSMLIYLLRPDAPAPLLAGSDQPVSDAGSRIAYLLSELQRSKATIVIPTPVVAELLVHAGRAAPDWLNVLTGSRHFRPAPFDTIAAVECAAMSTTRLGAGKLKNVSRAKAKFDEQIVAIAVTQQASIIYSDDEDVARLSGDVVKVIGLNDLPLPPQEAQGKLALEPAEDDEIQPPPPEA